MQWRVRMNVITVRHLSTRSLLFSLLFLAPGLALASSPTPGASESAPPSTVPQEAALSPEAVALEVLHTSARIVVELGAMSLTSVVVGIPGGIVGSEMCRPSSGFGSCIDEGFAGFFVGATVGAPMGIMWGARLLGGKGTWSGTLLGAGVGAGAGSVTAAFLASEADFVLIPAAAFAGSLLGSFVGYELSHAANSAPPAPSDVQMQPLVSASQGGMMVGLGGRF